MLWHQQARDPVLIKILWVQVTNQLELAQTKKKTYYKDFWGVFKNQMAEIKLNIQQGLESGNAKALRHISWLGEKIKKKWLGFQFHRQSSSDKNPGGVFWGSSGIPNEDHLIHTKKRGRKGGWAFKRRWYLPRAFKYICICGKTVLSFKY